MASFASMCLAFFAIFALCSSANAAGYASSGDYLAEAVLNGSNQMPPVTTGANGTFRITSFTPPQTFNWELMVMNITNLTMAHIHAGNASTAGPVVVPLVPTPSEKSSNASGLAMLVTPQSGDQTYTGTFTPANFTGNLTGMTAADMESMLMSMDNFYVNVHTTANPAGEIRGQLYMESMGPSMAPGMAPMPGMEPSMSPGSKMSPGAMSPSSKMSPGMSPSSMSPGSSPPPSGAGRASSTLLALVALVAGVSMLA